MTDWSTSRITSRMRCPASFALECARHWSLFSDGRGEEHSGTIFVAHGERLESLATYPVHKSLGTLYLSATQLLGYKFGDEYKVMGLAPYGDPGRYREIFDSLHSLHDKGDYRLSPPVL